MSIGKSPLVAIALALAIFVIGVGAGVGVDRMWLAPDHAASTARRGGPSPDRLLAKFKDRLSLSAEQAEAIGKILEDVDAQMKAIHEQVAPAKAKVREQTRARILALLTPEQAAEYEKIIAREERRRDNHKGKHRRGPGEHRSGPDK